jgi:hypothetical protein
MPPKGGPEQRFPRRVIRVAWALSSGPGASFAPQAGRRCPISEEHARPRGVVVAGNVSFNSTIEEWAKMLKKLLLATVVSGLIASGAWAQGPAGAAVNRLSSLMVSDAWAQRPLSAAGDDPSSAAFIAAQSRDQWVFSRFKGANVLGPNDEHIGDVSDLLFDKSGKIAGVIVGVGGFLGIGQKNVAIELSAFQVLPAGTDSTTGTNSNDATDVKLKVSWNRDQLKAAPDFQFYKPPATVGSGGTTGMGMRPNVPAPTPPGQ